MRHCACRAREPLGNLKIKDETLKQAEDEGKCQESGGFLTEHEGMRKEHTTERDDE